MLWLSYRYWRKRHINRLQRACDQRLQKAALLLTHTRLRIKEIAAFVGYEHTSSFTRAFERRFEQTPLAYRMAGRSRET